MLSTPLANVFTIGLLTLSPVAAQTCYNPDRTIAPNAVPCSANATNSGTFCCDPSAICLSTGYCLSVTSQPYQLYRGSCTDSGWGDFCAYYCVNYRTGSNAPITSVGLNDDGRAIYCCGDASGNQTSTECADGDPPFMLEDADMVLGRAALADVTSIAGNDSGLGTDGGNSSGGGSTGDHGTCPHSSSTCHSTAIGTGVGVPLGLLGLSAIAWALFERRRGRAGGKARTVAGPGPGDAIARGSEKTPISFQRNSEPRELDMSALSNARENTLLHGSPLSEMMGSEAKQ